MQYFFFIPFWADEFEDRETPLHRAAAGYAILLILFIVSRFMKEMPMRKPIAITFVVVTILAPIEAAFLVLYVVTHLHHQ